MNNYDPDLRRDTPLARKLKERIKRDGPITVADYMDACLNDPEYGYYRSKPAIGAQSDFVTAPEISQIFGELIGLWCAVVWQQMGSPKSFNLVELGPGRGTLMKDALRASRIVSGFHDAMRVHLVESNDALIVDQKIALAELCERVTWHDRNHDVPQGPAIVIANEFIDVVPVDHWRLRPDFGPAPKTWPNERTTYHDIQNWQQRFVVIADCGDLAFAWRAADPRFQDHFGRHFIRELAARFQRPPEAGDVVEAPSQFDYGYPEIFWRRELVGLVIDYGHVQASAGESLQAVSKHRSEHPLTSPGEADLTTHVDFANFRLHCELDSHAIDGPTTQGEFLGALGILERASRLMTANPAKAGAIEADVARLMSPQGMGTRFKVMGIRPKELPTLPGF